MQKNGILILALLGGVATWLVLSRGSPSKDGKEYLPYVRDWNAALETAKSTGKPILLNFGGPW